MRRRDLGVCVGGNGRLQNRSVFSRIVFCFYSLIFMSKRLCIEPSVTALCSGDVLVFFTLYFF